MKRISKKLVSILLSFIIVLSCSTLAFATDANDIANNDHSMQLFSECCPTEAMNYAQNAFPRLLQCANESGCISTTRGAFLGTPFTISFSESSNPVYYFPIICNNSFVGTFRVYLESTQDLNSASPAYTGIVSPFLGNELNYLAAHYSSFGSILIYSDNGNIMAKVGNSSLLLSRNKEEDSTYGSQEIISTDSLITISPYIPTTQTIHISEPMRPSASYLSLSIIETQDGNNWCGAYSTAIILRYLEGSTTSPTASGLMSLVYRRPSASDTFSINNTCSVAQMYGYDPTYVVSTLNSTIVFGQIEDGKPIYVNARRYDSTEEEYKYHAIVIRGYSRNDDAYSIWNPWNEYYETMDMITKEYVASTTRTYTWYSSVYDW